QHIVNALAADLDGEDLRLVAFAVALRAANENVAEELHLYLFVAHAAATLAAADPGVEGESARGKALGNSLGRGGEEVANAIEHTQIERGAGTWRAGERRLVHHHHFFHLVPADEFPDGPGGFLAGDATRGHHVGVEDIVDQRALARAGDARHAGENAER